MLEILTSIPVVFWRTQEVFEEPDWVMISNCTIIINKVVFVHLRVFLFLCFVPYWGVPLNCGEHYSFIYVLTKLLFLFFNIKMFINGS